MAVLSHCFRCRRRRRALSYFTSEDSCGAPPQGSTGRRFRQWWSQLSGGWGIYGQGASRKAVVLLSTICCHLNCRHAPLAATTLFASGTETSGHSARAVPEFRHACLARLATCPAQAKSDAAVGGHFASLICDRWQARRYCLFSVTCRPLLDIYKAPISGRTSQGLHHISVPQQGISPRPALSVLRHLRS